MIYLETRNQEPSLCGYIIMVGQRDRRASAAVKIGFDSQRRRLRIDQKIDINVYRGVVNIQFPDTAKSVVIKTFLNCRDVILDDWSIIYLTGMLTELLE